MVKTCIFLIFDLQEFAYDPQGVPNDNTGSSTLSAEMTKYYDKNLIREAGANLIHEQFAQKRPLPGGNGKKISFRKFAPLPTSVVPLTEGRTPDPGKTVVEEIEAEVKQYGNFLVHTDMLELTALDPVIIEDLKLLGDQAGDTRDKIVRNVMHTSTNVMYAPKNASSGTTPVTSRSGLDLTSVVTVDLMFRAQAYMKSLNVPTINGMYIAIMHPYVVSDLMRSKEWISIQQYKNPENIYKGEVGSIAGFRIMDTTNGKIINDSSCPANGSKYYSVFSSLLFGDNAYGVTDLEGGGLTTIVKQVGSSGTADALNQRGTVGWKMAMASELLIPKYMLKIESLSPDASATVAAN